MKRFFNSNLFYGMVSVVMAIFLMLFVTSLDDPVIERNFSDVGVSVSGLPEQYLLDNEPGQVEIRTSGLRSVINLSLARDVRASVDLRNAKAGTELYPVQTTLPSGLSLVFVRPEYISLTIDELGVLELPVTCHTLNTVRQGYSHSEPMLSPAAISVYGPQQILDQIAEAAVSIDLHDRTASYEGFLPIQLIGSDRQEILDSRLNLSSGEVGIQIPVSENLSSKSVSVRTALSGSVSDRYTLAGIEVNPTSVKITGSYAAVSTIEYLMTETIDLTPLTDTFRSDVRLVTPPGVSVLDGDRIELTIRLEKNYTQRALANIPIEVRNAPMDDTYHTEPETVNVILSAFPDQFEASTVDGELFVDIAVYVDLEELPPEDRSYPLSVDLSADYELTWISDELVIILHNAS